MVMKLRPTITSDNLHRLEMILDDSAELWSVFLVNDYSRTNQAVIPVLTVDQVTFCAQAVLSVELKRFALNRHGTFNDTLTWFTACVKLENDSGDLERQKSFKLPVFANIYSLMKLE